MGNKKQGINLEDLPEIIFGAEDDGDSTGDASGDSGDESGQSSNDESGAAGSSSDSSKGQTSHDDADDEKTIGLRTALANERKTNKETAKQLRLLQKEKDERDLAEKTDIEQANEKATRAEAKAEKLAAGFLKRGVDAAIKSAAEDAGFIDVSDALDGVDRTAIDVEQDEDDPTVLTLDSKAIAKLVKDLATKKPHFLKKGTDDGDRSGSQFGGSRPKKKTDDEALREKYPSLN